MARGEVGGGGLLLAGAGAVAGAGSARGVEGGAGTLQRCGKGGSARPLLSLPPMPPLLQQQQQQQQKKRRRMRVFLREAMD